MKKPILLMTMIIIIDQISKIYVKTHFTIGEQIFVTEWFRILFIENNGMAFGKELGGDIGKLILSVFRIFAVSGIFYWLYISVKKNAPKLLIYPITLILAGALGNIIDSVFYGAIFDASTRSVVSSFMPAMGGYAPILFGKVVDMLYFPIIDGIIPQWMPFFGGEHFIFFRPIFNFADASISIGVAILLVFYNRVDKKNIEKHSVQ